MLSPMVQPLAQAHDLIALDLDGVVYIGPDAVPGAVAALVAATELGTRLAFITNNAARPPESVSEHLRRLGLRADAGDVVTSAQAAARVLSRQLPVGSPVYLMGGEGLALALSERGLVPVVTAEDDPVAVVQGYGPEMPWKRVVLGAILVSRGLPWVVSNTDMTIPIADGVGPGNGTLVQLISSFAQRQPIVAGKPEPALFEETLLRLDAVQPLMVGDRFDTDIWGANRTGWPSLLVMTGVTDAAQLVAAPREWRPTFIGADLSALLEPMGVPTDQAGGWILNGWRATVSQTGELGCQGSGSVHDWWRCVATAGWDFLDRTGTPAGVDQLQVPASVG